MSYSAKRTTRYLRQILIIKSKVFHIIRGIMGHQYKTNHRYETKQLCYKSHVAELRNKHSKVKLGYLKMSEQRYCAHKFSTSFETLQKSIDIYINNILDCCILRFFPYTKLCQRHEMTFCQDTLRKSRDSRTNPASSNFVYLQ